MKKSKLTVLLMILVVFTVTITACNKSMIVDEPNDSEILGSEKMDSNQVQQNTVEIDAGPIESSSVSTEKTILTISKAPAINEVVDISYSIEALDKDCLNIEKVWVEFERYDATLYYPLGRGLAREDSLKFLKAASESKTPGYMRYKLFAENQPSSVIPIELILVNGELEKDGIIPGSKQKIAVNGKIKFPESGEWLVTLKSQANGESPLIRESVRLTIEDDKGTKGWQKVFPSLEGMDFLGDGQDFIVDLHLVKASQLKEETQFICTAISMVDIKDVTIQLSFTLMKTGGWERKPVPIEAVVIKGDPTRLCNLEKESPIQFPISVIFPETGDWEIMLSGTSPNCILGSDSIINVHINEKNGIFGWIESHIRKQEIPKNVEE